MGPKEPVTAADVLTCMLVFKEFPTSCFLCFLSTWPDAKKNSQGAVSIQTDPNFASSAGVVCRTFGHSPHVGERLPPNVECAVVISSSVFSLLRHSDPPSLSPDNVFPGGPQVYHTFPQPLQTQRAGARAFCHHNNASTSATQHYALRMGWRQRALRRRLRCAWFPAGRV